MRLRSERRRAYPVACGFAVTVQEARVMVSAYHLIWMAYGCWLPNDPRGSTSHVICCDVIKDLGELHYGRKRVQPASRDIRAFYARAKDVLRHERMEFSVEDRA